MEFTVETMWTLTKYISKYLLLVDESSTLAIFPAGCKREIRSPVKPQEKEINRD